MSAISVSSAQSFATAQSALLERLSQVELSLMESRRRVDAAIDQELASIRQWRQSLQTTESADFPFEVVKTGVAPLSEKSELEKIVPMNSNLRRNQYGEAQADPSLVQATVDELNAALEAAFNEISQR